MSEPIREFKDQYRFLSNFWMCPTQYGGVIYPSSEHAYQATKTLDHTEREGILRAETPGIAKKLGRYVKIRANWLETRINVMRGIVRDKFTRNPSLGAQLLLTGDAPLIEGNWWHDNFWGKCLCGGLHCQGGENWLGTILSEVRTELRP